MRLAALALACSMTCASGAETYSILPSDPQAGETVALTIAAPPPPGASCWLQAGFAAEVDGSNVTIASDAVAPRAPGMSGWCRAGATMTLPQAGTYQVRVAQLIAQTTPLYVTTGAALAVNVGPSTESAPAWRGLDGNWFDPAQSGWGVNLVQGDSGAIFAVLLTYRGSYNSYGQNVATGPAQPEWLVLPSGRWITPTTFRGALYTTTNSSTVGAAGAAQPLTTAIGFATLQFLDATHVRLSAGYVLPTGTALLRDATLQRFSF